MADTQLILSLLEGAYDIETGHQWTSDPVPVDIFNKAGSVTVTATPAPGQPPSQNLATDLEELFQDAIAYEEGQSFTTPSFVVSVPGPGGNKPFSFSATYTPGAAPAQQQAPAAKTAPSGVPTKDVPEPEPHKDGAGEHKPAGG